jgi:hypothetical protein
MKKCNKCKIKKELIFFNKNKAFPQGVNAWCKNCFKQYRNLHKEVISTKKKKYYQENKEKLKNKRKEYYRNNKKTIILKKKEHYKINKKEINKKNNKRYEKNKAQILTKLKKYYQINKNKIKKRAKKYYEKNKEKILLTSKKYYQKNKEKRNKYICKKKKTDIHFKLATSLRSRLCSALKRKQKNGSAVKDLGISINEFKIYLESKFQEGMTWENHGVYGWHIDHIKPLSRFDLTNKKQFLKACHYTNLQPLWAKENLKKGTK